jgi:hypothetical protein
VPGTRRVVLATLLEIVLPGTAPGRSATAGKRRGKGKMKRGASAETKNKSGNHCISPSGTDLNEVFGISAQIVATFCTDVGTGEKWTVAEQAWSVGQTFEQAPDGFVPAGATPLSDFRAKFAGVKYVIDPGTKREKTAFGPISDALFVIDRDEDFDVVSPTPLGTLKPLPAGRHVVEAHWVFHAMHCDGLGPDPALQCFPAGETLFHMVELEVTPGHK